MWRHGNDIFYEHMNKINFNFVTKPLKSSSLWWNTSDVISIVDILRFQSNPMFRANFDEKRTHHRGIWCVTKCYENRRRGVRCDDISDFAVQCTSPRFIDAANKPRKYKGDKDIKIILARFTWFSSIQQRQKKAENPHKIICLILGNLFYQESIK